MQFHNSQWLLTGSLFTSNVDLIFYPDGYVDFIEKGARLGAKNPWRRIEERIDFSVCNPATKLRHTDFNGRLYGNFIRGSWIKVTGELGFFEAVLIGSVNEPEADRHALITTKHVEYFLNHSVNLN